MSKPIPVADIKRLTLHDGPGLRTTVFVKGCPLRCLWCHNPESISPVPQLLFQEKLCSRCGNCVPACAKGAHAIDMTGRHILDREKCCACGKCVDACLNDALTVCGTLYTAGEIFQLTLRDAAFYGNDGGVTVSGGEPLLYPEFVRELFSRLRGRSIHTALDTCGEVPFERFEEVLPVTDLILYDLKGMVPERHLANTGRGNARILENLKRLGEQRVPLEIRMPVVPGCNDAPEEFDAAGKFLATLGSLTRIRLLAFHSMARGKYTAAGMADTIPHAENPSYPHLAELASHLAKYLSAVEIILPHRD